MELVNSKKRDLKKIAEIYRIEFSKPPYNEKWDVKKAISKIKSFYRNYDLYTIFLDRKIIGFVVVNPNFMCPGEVAFGEEIAIQEDFQNKGIGTDVHKKLFAIYRKKGFKKFMGIADINSKAYKLYLKLGILPSKQNILIEKDLS